MRDPKEEAAVVFAARKKEKDEKGKEKQKTREKQIRRAALLLERVNEKPPADLVEKAALFLMVQKIPDDIRMEATNILALGEAPGGGGDRLMSLPAETSRGDGQDAAGSIGTVAEELQPVVNDLALLLAKAVAAVPGAESLTAEDLSAVVSEVLAGGSGRRS
jgi:hypothetical protein